MFLAEVDISKTACFMTTQTFSQEVTKFIPCDDVTRFDGIYFLNFILTVARRIQLHLRPKKGRLRNTEVKSLFCVVLVF